MSYKDRKCDKAKARDKRYNDSDKGKARQKRYDTSSKGKAKFKNYESSFKGKTRKRKWYYNHEPITVLDIYKMILKRYGNV